LGPGSVGVPTCQDLELWVNVRAGVADGTQICNVASVTSDEWTPCDGIFVTGTPCFITQAVNELLREWCAAAGPTCDLTAIWNPDLDPYPLSIPRAPASIDDPETGILTDFSKRLVFYEVTNPSTTNSVRCMKNAVARSVTIVY
jgi:hypothetical protein